MTPIYLKIATIPGQRPGLKEEIAAAITPPGSMKKPETIAKWEAEEKPAAIKDAWLKTAFSGEHGEIVSIAWALGDDDVQCVSRTDHIPESDLLRVFFQAVADDFLKANLEGKIFRFTGHNIRDFDLRVLFQRAAILGIRPSIVLPHESRPGNEFVFDTMTAWAGWGNRISLDRICNALGLPVRPDMEETWTLFQGNRQDLIEERCRFDVERIRMAHQRLTFAAEVA